MRGRKPILITAYEASSILGVTVKTVRNWVNKGKLNHFPYDSISRTFKKTEIQETQKRIEKAKVSTWAKKWKEQGTNG